MHCSGIAQLHCAGRNGNTEAQEFDGYIGKLTRSTPSVLNMNYLGLRGGQATEFLGWGGYVQCWGGYHWVGSVVCNSYGGDIHFTQQIRDEV